MSRSQVFDHLIRIARIADYCETRGISTKEGSERAAALELPRSERRAGRREFLKNMGKLAAVGAGLAGLVCADELKKNRIQATIFDANTRAGGRCWSLRNFFPGQVAERGGEFIDTPHKTLLDYARQFNLALEAKMWENKRAKFFISSMDSIIRKPRWSMNIAPWSRRCVMTCASYPMSQRPINILPPMLLSTL